MKLNRLFHLTVLLFLSLLLPAQDKLSTGDHFADVNGFKIHYVVCGNGPVCFVPAPGWGPSVDYLKNSLKPFENYFTIVYYDTRITGQSTGPDDPLKYTSRIFMEDLDKLREYLELSKVWLMGHSAGGFQVLYYGIHHNYRVNGIIALSPFGAFDDLRNTEFSRIVERRKEIPGHEKGYNILSGKDTTRYSADERMRYILPFYFHDTVNISKFQKLSNTPMSAKAGEYTSSSGMGLEYLLPDLHRIKVPVLVVVGDDDFICDKVSQADRIAGKIKNSTEVIIKDAGHFSWVEQPGQFFNECTAWFRKQGLKESGK